MSPRFNYDSITFYYQKIRKILHFKHFYLVVAGVFLFCLALGLFFYINYLDDNRALPQKNICEAVTQSFAPLPTEINPNFLTQINDCFIPSAAVYGYSLRITSGFRTVAEQNQIYDQGRNDDGDIVTEAPGGRSIHNFGYAADVVDSKHEYNINWKRLAKIGAFCGLEAGDDWDFTHYEYRGGLTTADFVTGSRPSPLMLPCAIMEKRAKANQPLTLKDLQNCGAPKF